MVDASSPHRYGYTVLPFMILIVFLLFVVLHSPCVEKTSNRYLPVKNTIHAAHIEWALFIITGSGY